MNPAAAYTRTSTEDQAERQTIQAQRDYAESYARLNGIAPLLVYEDEGVSGALPLEKRPAGKRLLEDARAGKFSRVLIYRVDRLSRSVLDLLRSAEELKRAGVTLRSMTEPFETDTPIGAFVLQMLGSIAELEKAVIRERTMLGAARVAREGKWNGGPAPFGYHVEDGFLCAHEPEAVLVREIYALYLAGWSSVRISAYLNARNVPNPRHTRGPSTQSHLWDPSTVLFILKNPIYKGERTYRRFKVMMENGVRAAVTRHPPEHHIVTECEALIDAASWEAVQPLIARNRIVTRHPKEREFLLRGLLFCGQCGNAYRGEVARRQSGAYAYYRCRPQARYGAATPTCTSPSLVADEAEALVWAEVLEFTRRPAKVLREIARAAKAQVRDSMPLEQEQEQIARALAEKTEERGRIIGLARRAVITETEAEQELRALAAETALLEARRNVVFTAQERAQAVEARLTGADACLRQLRDRAPTATAAEKRAILEGLLERALVRKRESGEPYVEAQFRFRISGPVGNASPYSVDPEIRVFREVCGAMGKQRK